MMSDLAGIHTELVTRLQAALDKSSTGKTKTWWESYLKGAITFRGVGIAEIRSILTVWRCENGLDSWSPIDQFALALRLFEEPIAEDKLAGILYLQIHLYNAVPWRESMNQFGVLFERGFIADWNTCDWFCVRVLGPTIEANGPACASAVAEWSTSPELWKARASVVGFVPVIKTPSYHALVLHASASLIKRNERFAKTGVGWILRDLSKHDPELVLSFVAEHLASFTTESIRNALKYSPESIRQKALQSMRASQHQHASDGSLHRR